MNMPRMLVLGLAVVAAVAAVLIVRGLMGGGTPSVSAMVSPPAITTSEVLVASEPLQPGEVLTPALTHWQKWPRSNVDSTFITHEETPNLDAALNRTVVRAPMVEGEPISSTKFVHSDSAGFLAATLQPGMQAVSIPITTESGAGGFILPNDRVDILESEQISDSPRRFHARVVLTNVRVLAMDQTYKQDKDQKVVLAKTATLELSPAQSRVVVKAQAGGPLSLALRALGDNAPPPVASNTSNQHDDPDSGDNAVTVIRFGTGPGANGRKE
ncbi:MAG TPA: Flp pilus assembly protein CpaB [Rhizomicrobium sp.]